MVEPLDFLEEKELLGFLHIHKTELSLMDNPQTFLSQLRDYSLITKEQYAKINRMKSKENIRSAVYNALDVIEMKHPKHIHRFWRCAFKETILIKYPTLRLLRNSLFDGSYQAESALLDGVDMNDTNVEDEPKKKEKEDTKGKRRKKEPQLVNGDDEDGEEPSTSSHVTPRARKTPKKPCFSSPLKKGEKGEIWTWPIYKVQFPVTCGNLSGVLNRDRLARGEKCIVVGKRWFSPSEFEREAGKGSSKNWKKSIYCMNTPLGNLLQEGHLKCKGYKGGPKAKKSLFPSEDSTSETELETEDDVSDSDSREGSSEEQEEEDEGLAQLRTKVNSNTNVLLKVVCEDISGLLHTKRFASGTCGRSIRTESCWLTPVDFMKEASCQTDMSWKKHIKCEGRPLGVLLKARIHSLLCNCSLCVPGSEDLDNDKNDDECWVCHREGTEAETLVQCDQCPRSFHQQCHLPHIQDALLADERLWMCTPCVFMRTKELYPERGRDEAMACSIMPHMLHCQYLLLGLYRADDGCIFKSDPRTLPDYTRVIQTPMWLDHVAEKVQDKRYQSVGDFVSDIQLIFTNCASYNRNNPEFRDIGIKMKDLFEKEHYTVFKIQPVAS